MRLRGRRAWVAVPAAALFLMLPGATGALASGGYVIEQKEGRSLSRLTLLPAGMRFELLVPPRARRRAKPQVGVIVRYRDAHLFLLDPEHRRYDSLSLSAAVSTQRTELAAARKGQPSERLPVQPGTRRTNGQATLTRPRARLRRLALTRRIGGLPARAYLLRQGQLRERFWYSPALPQPPQRVRRLLAQAMSGPGAGPFGAALKGEAGRVPVRIDVRRGKRWRQVLRTTRVRRGPRASVALMRAARAGAVLDGRDYATPDDVKARATAVLRHRVILAPELEVEGRTTDDVLSALLSRMVAPA